MKTRGTRSRRFALPLAAVVFLAAGSGAAEPSWTGVIGDSMCGASHSMDGGGNEMSDAACVISCVKGGEKYVLVSEGKSLEIANQDFAGLAAAAGTQVLVEGETEGGRIRVTKIEPLRKPKEPEESSSLSPRTGGNGDRCGARRAVPTRAATVSRRRDGAEGRHSSAG